jgi:hypothetical protein
VGASVGVQAAAPASPVGVRAQTGTTTTQAAAQTGAVAVQPAPVAQASGQVVVQSEPVAQQEVVGTGMSGDATVTVNAVPPPPPPPVAPPVAPPGTERTDQFARFELTMAQASHGGWQGVGLCLIANCGDWERTGNLLPMLGAGVLGSMVGAGVAWFSTGDGVTLGQATAVESGTSWGLANGFGLLMVIQPSVSAWRAWVGTAMATTAVGTGVGAALAVLNRPHSGDVSLANSGGIWAAVFGLEAVMATSGWNFGSAEAFVRTNALTAMVLGNGGLVAASLLAPQLRWTRSRVAYIDIGGGIGTGLGALVGFLFGSGMVSSSGSAGAEGFARTIGITMMIGTAAGVVGGFLAAPVFDRSTRAEGRRERRTASRTQTTWAPVSPDGGAGITLGGTF